MYCYIKVASRSGTSSDQVSHRFALFPYRIGSQQGRVASMMMAMVMTAMMMMMVTAMMMIAMMMMVMMLPSHHPSFLLVRSVELWLAVSEPDFLAIGRGRLGFTNIY